ncbi:MAG: hypothetical protein GXP38_08635, partial [Chloroflexi bacterium]|nr:hypothetical protein [Chloroflexota bacterium]
MSERKANDPYENVDPEDLKAWLQKQRGRPWTEVAGRLTARLTTSPTESSHFRRYWPWITAVTSLAALIFLVLWLSAMRSSPPSEPLPPTPAAVALASPEATATAMTLPATVTPLPPTATPLPPTPTSPPPTP